jgi:cytochrome c
MSLQRCLIVGWTLAFNCLVSAACSDRADVLARALTEGEPERGSRALADNGCGACHRIPGVARARGLVGPPLAGLASRSYLAGRLPNEPLNLIRWIRHPREVDPATAMPEQGVSDADARDMAAYLYTLR